MGSHVWLRSWPDGDRVTLRRTVFLTLQSRAHLMPSIVLGLPAPMSPKPGSWSPGPPTQSCPVLFFTATLGPAAAFRPGRLTLHCKYHQPSSWVFPCVFQALQSNLKYSLLPRRLIISKRLAQCLHPALPSGVHLKALETYEIIFKIVGTKWLAKDLFLYRYDSCPIV